MVVIVSMVHISIYGVSWQGNLESHTCKKYFHLSTVIIYMNNQDRVSLWDFGIVKLVEILGGDAVKVRI